MVCAGASEIPVKDALPLTLNVTTKAVREGKTIVQNRVLLDGTGGTQRNRWFGSCCSGNENEMIDIISDYDLT